MAPKAKKRRLTQSKKTTIRKDARLMTVAVKKQLRVLKAAKPKKVEITKKRPATASTTTTNRTVEQNKFGTKPYRISQEVLLARRQAADRRWEDRFKEMLEFKEEHGHCLVPKYYKKNPSLSQFVQKNRRGFKAYKNGEKSILTKDKIQRLHDIGFLFHATGTAAQSIILRERMSQRIDERFEHFFKQLCDYKAAHGHCYVPRICRENPKLQAWVRTQRSKYKKKSEGHAVNFSDEQVKRLNDIGFCWDCKTDDNWKERENNKRYLKSGALWDERYERLLKFKAIHGHCNVPKVHKEDQVLSSWVYFQRKQYKLKQEGKQNLMKDDRLMRLVEIGFSFRTRGAAQAQIQTCGPEDSGNKSSIAMGSVVAKSQACGSEDSDNKSSIDLTEEMLAVKNSSRKLIKARKYISNNVKEASSEDDVEGEPDSHSVSGIGSMILGQWINSSKLWLVRTFQRGRENT